jgi:flagellar hook assembly protein FlgD
MRRLRHVVAPLLAAVLLATLFATTVAAADPSTTTLSVVEASPQANHPLTLVAVVDPATTGWDTDATFDFTDTDAALVICDDKSADPGNATQCVINFPTAGTHHYTATYSGNTVLDTSTSVEIEVVVAPDTVDATNVGRNLSTFYPVKDGYRDTVTISGNRQELIKVTIRIYNAGNTKVKQVTKTEGVGHYAYSWNGRNAAGTILAAGKYKIVQTLVDHFGTTKAFTSYVYLSKKKLVTKSTYVTKSGANATVTGYDGTGSVAKSTTGGILRLKAGNAFAGAGWQFVLPSATIYKSIAFQLEAKAPFAVPPTQIAVQNFVWCARSGPPWNTACFNHVKNIGNSSGSLKWYSTSGNVSSNRDGRYVRGLVYVQHGTVYVYKVRIKVTYQVLQ